MKLHRSQAPWAFASLLLAFSAGSVHSLTPEQLRTIEDYMQNTFLPGYPSFGAPVAGVGFGIVHGDQVYARGFGHKNIERGEPATHTTLFGVGSLSKMLSALFIVHTLSQRFPALGELVVDQPVNKLAPNLNLVLSDRYRTEYITFRDLLSHRTCITDLMIIPIGIGATNKSHALHEQRYIPESCEFRSIQFSYNQPMIQVAGEALASTVGDGRSFEELLIEFLRTLGMVDTRIIQEDDDYSQIPNMSQPYYTDENRTLQPMNSALLTRMSAVPAAAGVLTSARDMTQLIKLMLNRGRVDGVQLVKEEVFDWIARVSTPFRREEFYWKTSPDTLASGDLGYGLGWVVAMFDGGYQQLTHPGSNVPYETLIDVFPALNLGIFTSVSGGAGRHYELRNLVAGLVLGYDTSRLPPPARRSLTFEGIAADPLLKRAAAAKGARPPAILPTPENTVHVNHSIIVGHYGLPVAGEFTIRDVNETTLYLAYGRWMTGYLTARDLTPAIYDLEIDSDLGHHFGGAPAEVTVSFALPGVALLTFLEGTYPFVKDYSPDMLPEIPWGEGSCGPGA